MQSLVYDIVLEQGSQFDETWTFFGDDGLAIDFTGSTAVLHIGTIRGGTPLVTLTQADGLVLGGPAGTVAVTVTTARIALLPVSLCFYDLVITDSLGVPHRYYQGDAAVSLKV